MMGTTTLSSSKYFLSWASLMAGSTILSAWNFGASIPGTAMDRISSDRLDRALNWTLWSTGAVMGSVGVMKFMHHSLGPFWNNSYLFLFSPYHIGTTVTVSMVYIYVIKNVLPHLTKNVPPLVNRLLYGAIGTAVTGAVTSAALQVFTKSYTPWGYKGLAIQAIFSLACGLLYSQLGERGLQESVKDHLNGWAEIPSPAPDWVKNEVVKAPEVFGKQLGEKKYRSQRQTHYHLPPILEGLGLQGDAREKFGLAFARAADVKHRRLAELKLHPMIHFDQILDEGRKQLLSGNLIIQALSKVLAYESHHVVVVGPPLPNPLCPLDKVPEDVIRHMSSYIAPSDILALAQSSRRYYHCLGLKGAPLWNQRKIDCFRVLSNEHRNSINIRLCQALLLASPDRLLDNLEEFAKMKDEVAILRSEQTPHEKFLSLINHKVNPVLMARLLSHNPELFKEESFWESCFKTEAALFWNILTYFGLPREALEPFCEGIRANRHTILKIDDESPLVMAKSTLNAVIATAEIDYPYFDFIGEKLGFLYDDI
ncbi:MAG: hypothetical protein ABSA17_06050 [Rhabdochlamydiaceae bacterium]|jgi:hypothetical protein